MFPVGDQERAHEVITIIILAITILLLLIILMS